MKKGTVLLLLIIYSLSALAQSAVDETAKKFTKDLPAKASLNYEALTKFYQATVTTGKDGEYKFKASIFGINKLFVGRRLELTDYYNSPKGTFQRNTEISIGMKKNSQDQYNNLTYAVKYAVFNKGDKSKANFFEMMKNNISLATVGEKFLAAINTESNSIDASVKDPAKNKEAHDAMEAAIKKFTASKNANDLPVSLKNAIEGDWTNIKNSFDSMSKEYDKKGVLTFSAQSGYDFSAKANATTTGMLQYIKGVAGTDKPTEIDARLALKLEADSTKTSLDLSRSILSFNLGLNKVIARTQDDDPFIEVELAADYTSIMSGTVYAGEYKETKNGIAYLKIHVTKQFTIPASIKFDLEHPNVLGFLQVQWNMETKKDK